MREDPGTGKTLQFPTTAYPATATVDLRAQGASLTPARRVVPGTSGPLVLENYADGSDVEADGIAGIPIEGRYDYLSFGTKASLDSAAGSYPADLAGESITVRADEGTIFDTGDVEVELTDGLTQAAFIALVNAALNAAVPYRGGQVEYPYLTDGGSDVTNFKSRGRGTDHAVEIVAISDAAVDTATGFTATDTDAGAQLTTPATKVQVTW